MYWDGAATRLSPRQLANFFYDVNYTLGDAHGDDALYFHTHWQRERPTLIQRDYEVLPLLRGCGRFLGMSVGVIADMSRYADSWWGEVKIYLDGDRDYPTLCGTGVEDHVGNGWAGNTEVTYAHAYQGFPLNRSARRGCRNGRTACGRGRGRGRGYWGCPFMIR